jgi:hypothetical protein
MRVGMSLNSMKNTAFWSAIRPMLCLFFEDLDGWRPLIWGTRHVQIRRFTTKIDYSIKLGDLRSSQFWDVSMWLLGAWRYSYHYCSNPHF